MVKVAKNTHLDFATLYILIYIYFFKGKLMSVTREVLKIQENF